MLARVSRRRFMRTALAAAPAGMAGLSGAAAWPGWDLPSRRSLGFPVPEEGWHGDSSVGAAARIGRVLLRDEREDERERERPRRPPADSGTSGPSEWQRFAA